MQRLITDLFTNLRQRRQEAQDPSEMTENAEEAMSQAAQQELDELRQSTCEAYKNQKWTRVIALERHQDGDQRSWPIGPDLADDFDYFFADEEEELPEWKPVWDMAAATKDTPELKIGSCTLSEPQLRELAVLASKFRLRVEG